jgi:hypothetical protein|tara:strand:- start:1214 stop:1420 length:207 start_codon:yes stop_codon:yes gene_type:complete
MDEFQDITLICICGDEFVWTAGEQKFYQEKGYFQPKRCVPCRKKKKSNLQREDQEQEPYLQKPSYELK